MESKQYIVTIEICSSKIVGALGEKSPNGSVSLIALESDRISTDCVRRGFVQNVEEAKSHMLDIIKRLESHITPSRITGVYVGVAGRSLHNMPVEITLDLDPNQLISEEVINNIVARCRAMNVDGEILDVVPCCYEIDGNPDVRNPIGSYSGRIRAKMNLIVAKNTLKINLQRVFDTVKVKGYIITPLAVADKILTNDERQLGCMLVDFGAETTTVSIFKNDALRYMATLPMGSRLITLDITNMNIIESKAEDLKLTVGNAMELEMKNEPVIDGVRVTDVSNYVVARVGEIGANIAEQISYAGMHIDDLAAGVTLIGGGSQLNGFSSFIEKTMKLKVTKGQQCPYVNIIMSVAENFIYIQSVALLATAADIIDLTDNCVYTPKEKPVEPPVEVKPPVEETPKEKPTQKKNSLFSLICDRLKSARTIFDDDSEGSDDSYSDDEEKSAKY